MKNHGINLFLTLFMTFGGTVIADDNLIGHWPLTDDGQDVSGNGMHAVVHGVH